MFRPKITNNCKKPLKWWFHKVMCEIGWSIRYKNRWKMYYYHLDQCAKCGFNLYGEPFKYHKE